MRWGWISMLYVRVCWRVWIWSAVFDVLDIQREPLSERRKIRDGDMVTKHKACKGYFEAAMITDCTAWSHKIYKSEALKIDDVLLAL